MADATGMVLAESSSVKRTWRSSMRSSSRRKRSTALASLVRQALAASFHIVTPNAPISAIRPRAQLRPAPHRPVELALDEVLDAGLQLVDEPVLGDQPVRAVPVTLEE